MVYIWVLFWTQISEPLKNAIIKIISFFFKISMYECVTSYLEPKITNFRQINLIILLLC